MNSKYIKSTYFIDSDNLDIINLAKKVTNNLTKQYDIINTLFLYVRDNYLYNPFELNLHKESLRASSIMKRKSAYCVEKAILLCALYRAVKIPSRLHFGNVRNHILTDRLERALKTDEMVFHGSTAVFFNNKWIKVTPAFNKSLCNKLGIKPLEFDGNNDSLFQQFDKEGKKFIEYTHDYGSFIDLPYEMYMYEFQKYYPHIDLSKNLLLKVPK